MSGLHAQVGDVWEFDDPNDPCIWIVVSRDEIWFQAYELGTGKMYFHAFYVDAAVSYGWERIFSMKDRSVKASEAK